MSEKKFRKQRNNKIITHRQILRNKGRGETILGGGGCSVRIHKKSKYLTEHGEKRKDARSSFLP